MKEENQACKELTRNGARSLSRDEEEAGLYQLEPCDRFASRATGSGSYEIGRSVKVAGGEKHTILFVCFLLRSVFGSWCRMREPETG